MKIIIPFRILFLLLAMLLLGGCATTANQGDPLIGLNRVFYDINQGLDRHLIKPIAEGYSRVTPKPVRTGITNFFDNISYINVIFNDVLQGKINQGLADSGRFLINSTIGSGGLFDPASGMGLNKHNEDLGQSFGVWGAGEGAYLDLPLLGPSSVRDAPDLATSTYLNPLFYVTTTVTLPLGALNVINKRANLLEVTRVRDEAALDPYIFTREAYRQKRIFDIYDGNPPEQDLLDESFDGEDEGVLTID